jgi:hypothetical protein
MRGLLSCGERQVSLACLDRYFDFLEFFLLVAFFDDLKYSLIAILIFSIASSSVAPWDQQPGSAGSQQHSPLQNASG